MFALAAPLLACLPPLVRAGGEDAPPGMLLVPGGRTRIGITQEQLKQLLSVDPNSQQYAGALSAETPQHEQSVDSFYAQLTEVTNEQYEAFVRATGSKPPQSWGEAAIRAGAEQFQQEQERAHSEASTQGLPLPEPAVFEPRAWWDANWNSSPWRLPEGDERRPVVFVDYAMASRYARWAGFRLPLEEEFQRAVRGDSEHKYPWGDDWDNDKYAATALLKKKGGPFVVGSFPAGASKQGLLDLSGNVWEWTRSPFVAYAGYDPKVFEFGYGKKVRKVNALTAFDETERVVVGGSFKNANLMCRATTRRDVGPRTATDALGFRCARSLRGGVDAASAVLEEDLTDFWRPREDDQAVVYDAQSACALERWSTLTPRELPGEPIVPGYAIVSGHEQVVWCPVRQIRAIDPGTFERLCADEGVLQLGFLTTSIGLQHPELPPGTYLVSYRQKGVPHFLASPDSPRHGAKPAREGPALEELLRIDVQYDHLILCDLHGTPLLALRLSVEYGTLRESHFELVESEQRHSVVLSASIASRTTQKGFGFTLELVPEPGALAGDWRSDTRR